MPEFGFRVCNPAIMVFVCITAAGSIRGKQNAPRGVGAPAVTHCYSPEGPRAILLCAVYRPRLRPTTRTVIPKKKKPNNKKPKMIRT
jgi:hypothetical protein